MQRVASSINTILSAPLPGEAIEYVLQSMALVTTVLLLSTNALAAPNSHEGGASSAVSHGQGDAGHGKRSSGVSWRAAECLAKADALRNSLESEQAIGLYTEALKIQPDLLEASFGRALAERDSEQFDAAAKDFQQAVSKDSPLLSRALKEFGTMQHMRQDYKSAKVICDRYLSYRSQRGTAYEPTFVLLQRADCELHLNMPAAALADASAVQSVPKPGNLARSASFRARARAYGQLHQYQKAVDDYTAAIKIVESGMSFASFIPGLGGAITLNDLLSERAKTYEKLGRSDLANRDRDLAKQESLDSYGDAPFRIHK